MLKRLFFGLFKGAFAGALVASVLIFGLGLTSFGGGLAYLFAALTGLLVALVSGRGIWVQGAKVENALKGVVGAAIACAALFALRKWVGFSLDLQSFSLGAGRIGELPAAALPVVGVLLGWMFELDHSGELEKAEAKRGGASKPRARVAADLVEEDEELEEPSRSAEVRRRRGL